MIKLLRVDHRLLHGQVAMTWTQALDTNCILIANDAVVNDSVRKNDPEACASGGDEARHQVDRRFDQSAHERRNRQISPLHRGREH